MTGNHGAEGAGARWQEQQHSLGGNPSSPERRPMARSRSFPVLCPNHNPYFISTIVVSKNGIQFMFPSLVTESRRRAEIPSSPSLNLELQPHCLAQSRCLANMWMNE